MDIEAQFDLLKKKIGQAYDWRDPASDELPELVKASLDSAENLLLQARQAHANRLVPSEKRYLKMAEMRYSLAQMHFKGPAKNRKKIPSLLSQHRIGDLGDKILSFKSKVEWKNTELTMAHRHAFNKIVNLFEDALNQLRDGYIDDAERTASGAWLYHYHLCCSLDEDPGEKGSNLDARKKLFGLLAKNKVPPAITGVKNLIVQMAELRVRFKHLQLEKNSAIARWEGLEDALDFLIGQAIEALVQDADKILHETTYKAQEHLVLMERFLRDLRNSPDSIPALGPLEREGVANGLCSRRQFYAMADSLDDSLKSRVALSSHITQRLLNLRRLYDQAMRSYEGHLSFETESLLGPAQEELDAIKLIVKEALLFCKD